MDNNTLKILGLGVVAWYLFIRKKPEPIVVSEIKDIPGCTDSTADNYDDLATEDDGTCIYPILGCTNDSMFNYDPLATQDDGTCTPVLPGCTDATATNYNVLANTDDGTCVITPGPILGCMNPTATNYNATATQDDATCTFTEVDCWSGCPTPAMTPSVATVCPATHPNLTQPSCAVPVSGCQNNQAYNYNPLATTGCS